MSERAVHDSREALPAETRARLLNAAGEAFADVGFHRATVREICRRAGANIAAVNYHFRDKAGLYGEVVRYGVAEAIRKYPPDMGLPAGAVTAGQRLEAFIRGLLFRLLEEGPAAWHGRLMMWEMVEPTGILGETFGQTIRPLYQQLTGLVAQLLGPAGTPERVKLCCASVLGQCTFYRLGATLLAQVQPDRVNPTGEQIEAIAQHVTRLTLAGLRDYAESAATGAAEGA